VHGQIGTTTSEYIHFMIFVQRASKKQNKLNVKPLTILFSFLYVLPRRMLKCSSVLPNKVQSVGAGGIDLEQQVKKLPSRFADELLGSILSKIICYNSVVTVHTYEYTASLM